MTELFGNFLFVIDKTPKAYASLELTRFYQGTRGKSFP